MGKVSNRSSLVSSRRRVLKAGGGKKNRGTNKLSLPPPPPIQSLMHDEDSGFGGDASLDSESSHHSNSASNSSSNKNLSSIATVLPTLGMVPQTLVEVTSGSCVKRMRMDLGGEEAQELPPQGINNNQHNIPPLVSFRDVSLLSSLQHLHGNNNNISNGLVCMDGIGTQILGTTKGNTVVHVPPPYTAQLPSRSSDGLAELYLISQPEEQHRARYQTEGSRGAVKDRSGAGYPTVKLSGYNKPVMMQVFVGSDSEKISPHMFYQVCRVSGKNSTPCKERRLDGTVIIETVVGPENDMTLSCDCVGILKERNVDVEHRFKAVVSRGRKKSTKCRLVFRATVMLSNGLQETLQIISDPISCTQPPGVPEIIRKSLSSSSVLGGEEMFILGKNFLKDTCVIFQHCTNKAQPIWEEKVTPDKETLNPIHLIISVPHYYGVNVSEDVVVQVVVSSGGKLSEPHLFTYTPLPGNIEKKIEIPEQKPLPKGVSPSALEISRQFAENGTLPMLLQSDTTKPSLTNAIIKSDSVSELISSNQRDQTMVQPVRMSQYLDVPSHTTSHFKTNYTKQTSQTNPRIFTTTTSNGKTTGNVSPIISNSSIISFNQQKPHQQLQQQQQRQQQQQHTQLQQQQQHAQLQQQQQTQLQQQHTQMQQQPQQQLQQQTQQNHQQQLLQQQQTQQQQQKQQIQQQQQTQQHQQQMQQQLQQQTQQQQQQPQQQQHQQTRLEQPQQQLLSPAPQQTLITTPSSKETPSLSTLVEVLKLASGVPAGSSIHNSLLMLVEEIVRSLRSNVGSEAPTKVPEGVKSDMGLIRNNHLQKTATSMSALLAGKDIKLPFGSIIQGQTSPSLVQPSGAVALTHVSPAIASTISLVPVPLSSLQQSPQVVSSGPRVAARVAFSNYITTTEASTTSEPMKINLPGQISQTSQIICKKEEYDLPSRKRQYVQISAPCDSTVGSPTSTSHDKQSGMDGSNNNLDVLVDACIDQMRGQPQQQPMYSHVLKSHVATTASQQCSPQSIPEPMLVQSLMQQQQPTSSQNLIQNQAAEVLSGRVLQQNSQMQLNVTNNLQQSQTITNNLLQQGQNMCHLLTNTNIAADTVETSNSPHSGNSSNVSTNGSIGSGNHEELMVPVSVATSSQAISYSDPLLCQTSPVSSLQLHDPQQTATPTEDSHEVPGAPTRVTGETCINPNTVATPASMQTEVVTSACSLSETELLNYIEPNYFDNV